jgi:SAM-dependent methyltransferase
MSMLNATLNMPRNPHFDDDLVIWNDSYSGRYGPVPYEEQFDRQWRLFLEGRRGFSNHTGVETSDEYIDDRIHELTGIEDFLLRRRWGRLAGPVSHLTGRAARRKRRGVGGRLFLEPKFPIDYFMGKRCLDLGCGAGRWTRTLLALGARVKSTDVSQNGLQSTRRFNDDVERVDLFDIIPRRADLQRAFDVTLSWGVVMCTHDPRLAFTNVARTVRSRGSLYLMVYAPTFHASEYVLNARRHYHTVLKTAEARAAYVLTLAKNDLDNAINYHDMLNTFYNWTIDEDTILGWCASEGFETPVFLNATEPHKCAHHVLARKAP